MENGRNQMSLKVYCNRYAHFKDVRVCSFNCAYRARCRDFALFYDGNRAATDEVVAAYIAARRIENKDVRAAAAPLVALTNIVSLLKLEVKIEMAEAAYIWVDKDDRAELLSTEEVLRRAERGTKAKHIYKVSQEMELRYQLVPRRGIEKAKRLATVENERREARRSRLRAVAPETDFASPTTTDAANSQASAASTLTKRKTAPATRRPRRLPSAKAAGG
jgi:hypothetical protein